MSTEIKHLFSILSSQVKDFINFLFEKKIFQTGFAFVLAMQINKLFVDFINYIIAPIVNKVVSETTEERKTTFFGIQFKTGNFIISLINFILVIIFLFYMYKIADNTQGVFGTISKNFSSFFGY